MSVLASQQPFTKKRSVLGEISSNVVAAPKKSECGANNKRVKKAVVTKKSDDAFGSSIDVDGDSNDPQMCAAYASDIYQYLRNMEVCKSFLSCLNFLGFLKIFLLFLQSIYKFV